MRGKLTVLAKTTDPVTDLRVQVRIPESINEDKWYDVDVEGFRPRDDWVVYEADVFKLEGEWEYRAMITTEAGDSDWGVPATFVAGLPSFLLGCLLVLAFRWWYYHE